MTFKEFLNESKGTYAAFKYSEDSKDLLEQLILEYKVPNPVSRDDLHTTLLYSRRYLPDYEPVNRKMLVEVDGFDIFETDEGKVLVLRLNSDDVVNRHKELMDIHNATYDFDEYIPHITLSYDVGDMLKPVLNGKYKLEIIAEYKEELND